MAESTGLRLIQGGRRDRWRRGGLELVVAVPGAPPFPVERTVVEEDRWRVLGASPEWRPPPPEHPIRLHTALVDETPLRLGHVLQSGRRWHAVVVDLDAEPLVRPDAVRAAIARLADLCARAGIARLGLPLLGTVHGDLDHSRALAMLHDGLLLRPPPLLERIWLQVPPSHLVRVEQTLGTWGGRSG